MSLELKGLSFGYGKRQVLHQVSLKVEAGCLCSLLGPNGVGKSTLFKCILRLIDRYEGQVLVDGQSTDNLGRRDMAVRMAYVPQNHTPAFNFSVLDMVLMGTTARLAQFSQPGRHERDIAMAALEKLHMADMAHRDFLRISGGEKQLALVARALAQQSRILIMDEPTANLDFGNQLRVMSRIRALAEEGYIILQSTHNPEQAYQYSHQVAAMLDGRMIGVGAPAQVMTDSLMEQLYGVPVAAQDLCGGRYRAWVPQNHEGGSPI